MSKNTDFKYIVIAKDEKEHLISFPHNINHDHMAEAVKTMKTYNPSKTSWKRGWHDSKVISAGFVTSMGLCYGHSESLNIHSRPEEDTRLYQRLD